MAHRAPSTPSLALGIKRPFSFVFKVEQMGSLSLLSCSSGVESLPRDHDVFTVS